jgi:hypothetical protein
MKKETYEAFKEMLKQELKSQGMDFEVKKVFKVNQELDGIGFGNPKEGVQSVFYLQDLFQEYQAGQSLTEIAEMIKENAVKRTVFKGSKLDELLKGSGWRQKLIAEVINTKVNEELLLELPYRSLFDLSVIYRIEFSNGSIIVNDALMETLNTSEPELYKLAKENISERYPLFILQVFETFYAVSNKEYLYGANAFLFEEKFEKMAECAHDDIYIIPSSIHELLFVRASLFTEEELLEIVRDANRVAVSTEEFLSNNIYHYSRKTKKLKMITR